MTFQEPAPATSPLSPLTIMTQSLSSACPVPPSRPLILDLRGQEEFPEQEAKSVVVVTQEHTAFAVERAGQAEFQFQSWILGSPPATLHCHRAASESPLHWRPVLLGDTESTGCPKGTQLHQRGCGLEKTPGVRKSPPLIAFPGMWSFVTPCASTAVTSPL